MTTSEMPGWWQGTYPEWVVFSRLEQMGKQHRRDFIYNPNPDDGITFRFINPSDLAINVTGLMQNYELGEDSSSRSAINKQQLIGLGVHLIFIEDVDLRQDATYYINEALQYRDHSHMGA